jgi:hypothetical protein
MASGCLNVSRTSSLPEPPSERQLRLVEDTETRASSPEEGTTGCAADPDGAGQELQSLGAYVRSLRSGAACFSCGAELRTRQPSGRLLSLVCPACGAEVERTVVS